MKAQADLFAYYYKIKNRQRINSLSVLILLVTFSNKWSFEVFKIEKFTRKCWDKA